MLAAHEPTEPVPTHPSPRKGPQTTPPLSLFAHTAGSPAANQQKHQGPNLILSQIHDSLQAPCFSKGGLGAPEG